MLLINIYFNFLLILILQHHYCESMFNIKLNNMNKEGCKQYGINCNSEDKSIKLYEENIKYIGDKKPILFRKPNDLKVNLSKIGKGKNIPTEEHFNEIDQSIKSMLKNTSIHKELYTKEENNPKYYRANSSSLLIKKSNEGLIPLELITTKLNGTIKLPLEKDEKN